MNRFFRAVAPAFLALVLVSSDALASEQSEELIRKGLTQLDAGQVEDASRSFVEATNADPNDGRAFYFLGTAFNRLGEPHAALGAFREALRLKALHESYGFEAGWAALETGDAGAAAIMLAGHFQLFPKDAKAAELLGRAYLQVGETDAGERMLDRAVELDPSLKPSVLAYKAQLAAARNDETAVAGALQQILDETDRNPIRDSLVESLEPPAQQPADAKPWTVFGNAAIGRSSNVIALSEKIAQPADITRKDSKYYDLSAGAQYRHLFDTESSITVGGTLGHRNYQDISGNDTQTANLFVSYQRMFRRDIIGSLTGTFGHTRVDGDKFQNTWGISPAVQILINDRLRLDLSATSTTINLPAPTVTPANLDRDSHLRTAGGSLTFAFPDLDSEVFLGARLLHNSAVGSDYDYFGRQLSIGVRTALPWDIVAGAGITSTHYDYKNLNSLAPTNPPGPTGFGFTREDTINVYSINLSRPINDTYTAFANFSKTDAASNLDVFTYDQKDFQIGISARF